MTFAEAVQTLTKLVYTTSDKGAYFIHSRYKNTPYEEVALREYIYVKAYLAVMLCVHIAGKSSPAQIEEAGMLAQAMTDNLKRTFASMPSSMNYGCDGYTLEERILHYSDESTNHNFNLGTTATDYLLFVGDVFNQRANVFEITQVFTECIQDMQAKMAKKQSSSGGCGCTSAIASFAAAIALMMAL